MSYLARLLGDFVGEFSFRCFFELLACIAIESGLEPSDAVRMHFEGNKLHLPDVLTVAVLFDEEEMEVDGMTVRDTCWKFYSVVRTVDFGPETMALVHSIGLDFTREIPENFGHKVLLKCKTREPLKGQSGLSTGKSWQYLTIVKKGLQWFCVNGFS